MNHEWLLTDTYRTAKEEHIKILQRYNIIIDTADKADTIRQKVIILKNSLKLSVSEPEVRKTVYEILSGHTPSTPELITKHKTLQNLIKITKREDTNEITQYWFDTLFVNYRVLPNENKLQPTTSQTNEPENKPNINSDSEFSDSDKETGNNTLNQTTQHIMETPEKLPLISAGTFNGLTSENPNDFLEKFLMASESNRWTEKSKLRLFPTHLSGTALAWYRRYKSKQPTQTITDWETLRTDFLQTFAPLAQSQNLQIILENRLQGQDEPSLSYFLDVLTTCKRYEPNITDDRVIQYIIQGLRPNICDQVLTKNNTTLDNLETNLQDAEKYELMQRSNREKYNRRQTAQKSENPPLNMLNNIQEQINNLTRSINNWSTKNQTQPQHRYPSRNNTQNYPQNRIQQDQKYTGAYPKQTSTPTPNYRQPPPIQNNRNYIQGQNYNRNYVQGQNYKRNYVQPSGQNDQNKMFCTICKKNNHSTHNCWFKNNQNQPKNTPPSQPQPQHNPKAGNTPMYCNYCKRTNHTIQNCFRSKFYQGNH